MTNQSISKKDIKLSKSILDCKKKLQKENLHGIALDIDETLSWTLGYWFTELVKLFGDPENLGVEGLIKNIAIHGMYHFGRERRLMSGGMKQFIVINCNKN